MDQQDGGSKIKLRNRHNTELPDVVSVKQSELAPAVKLPTCILEVPCSKPGRGKTISWLRFSIISPCLFTQMAP